MFTEHLAGSDLHVSGEAARDMEEMDAQRQWRVHALRSTGLTTLFCVAVTFSVLLLAVPAVLYVIGGS